MSKVYNYIINKIMTLEENESCSFVIEDLKARSNGLDDKISIGVKRINEFDSEIILLTDWGTGTFTLAFGIEWHEKEIKKAIDRLFDGYGFVTFTKW